MILKPRIWHKARKKYYECKTISYQAEGVLAGGEVFAFTEIELEWPTGREDRSGREVYEGDICWYEESFSFIVRLKKGCFYTNVFSDFDPLYRFKQRDIEIIGTIRENPDLTEAIKPDGTEPLPPWD